MILSRTRDFLKYRHLSFNKFEKSLGVSHGSISNAWKHERNIGSNVVEKILLTYPEINAEWLLRGKGEMLKGANSSEPNREDLAGTESDEELIAKVLEFFALPNRDKLHDYLNHSLDADGQNPLEKMILRIWENKYGGELKTIKRQLMTLFTSNLDQQKKSKDYNSDSKMV